MKRLIHMVHLYPHEMNIYGDTGNRLVLQRRMEWRGIAVKTTMVGVGDELPKDVDIIIGGGGQDAGQEQVQADLAQKASQLIALAEAGTVMVMICGLYQLFGRRFVTGDGVDIAGIGLLPLETIAGSERLIGNTHIETAWGKIVAYENHSGKTMLDDTITSFGIMELGAGNNGADGTEGCIYKNVFGTYAHGPLLSKNPAFADELISRALEHKYQDKAGSLAPLDDTLEHQAYQTALTRPR